MSFPIQWATFIKNRVMKGIAQHSRAFQHKKGDVRALAAENARQETHRSTAMNPNSEQFIQFLHHLGVEMEHQQEGDQEPDLTILQLSRDHEVFYRLDLTQGTPQLRIFYPESRGRLKVHIYLIQLSDQHPLAKTATQFTRYQGSQAFERERDVAAHHLLFALGEMMKALFWAGVDVSHFPKEITVQKLL